ncbi:FAD-binding domain-containing protein [Corynespora cassiicola Philippines]|uniref:FAD-binding domain-containing protein n=1 Tax=Corynespora cassiicola Philippines TaxID=1448308 RepID=A0A2T2P8U1_CORCC|nr:FAD-binding domain-containing protein [Corynespora cassiicola Philippines]
MVALAMYIFLLWHFYVSIRVRAEAACKCIPQDDCWPATSAWNELNGTTSGKLIKTTPVALPCYPGAQFDESLCSYIYSQWTNASFQSSNPVGLFAPTNITCPPIDLASGQQPGTCTLGTNPVYAVNSTDIEHVQAAVDFARSHNVRLVIKSTGHDLLGRSDGPGSLEIWLRHLRKGISFQESFVPEGCSEAKWTGNAFKIGGGYVWGDVYAEAEKHGVIVVGGGAASVSAIGGWMQGGGHGPASRQFGVGADQVLEAEVFLADGNLIIANACQNQDVYFAIRGGGPGTYGVVVSTVIKAWPMVNVTVQNLAIGSLTPETGPLLEAVTDIYQEFPDLNDAGYAGYGSWSIANPAPLFANFTSGYVHGVYVFNKTEEEARKAFDPLLEKLSAYNMSSLFVSVTYVAFPDFWSFYWAASSYQQPAGSDTGAMGSRFFDRSSLQKDRKAVRDTMDTIAGTPDEYTIQALQLVSGGQVFKDAQDEYSGLNPTWRKSYFFHVVARGWVSGASDVEIEEVRADILSKTRAMEALAPDTGTYMNEASRLDPEWKKNFYGEHLQRLEDIKRRRDGNDLFYCPTCVGSDNWAPDGDGRLCRA